MSQPARILVVDDEPAVRMMLEAALRAQGYRVEAASNGTQACKLLATQEYDLLLLDLRLGDIDGIEILREAKNRWPATEVILLTAHGSINSAIAALRYGAFDYLLKPAHVQDIREQVERGLARRRAAQQRSELLQRIGDTVRALGAVEASGMSTAGMPHSDRLEVGPLIVDLGRHSAVLGGHTLMLTRTEYALLTAMAQQPNTVLNYTALSEAVYGRGLPEDEARSLLRPHIARLRHKLEAVAVSGVTLASIRGMGYMLRTG